MSKPQPNKNNPGTPGQIKTMFAVEGNSTVSLVIEERGQMRDERMWFPDLSHAFTSMVW